MARPWHLIGPAIVAAALQTGCAPPRTPPPAAAAVAPPPAWREGAEVGSDIDQRWWNLFSDPALASLVEEALASNEDVAIAVERVEEARAQFALARAQERPAIDVTVAAGSQRALNAFGMGTDQSVGQLQLASSYDADLFGRLRASRGAARVQLIASRAARDGVRLAVAASVVTGYVKLLSLQQRMKVLRQTLFARAAALHLARRRADAGYAPRLDLALAESDYRATEQLLPQAELAVTLQENGLSVLLSRPPGAILTDIALDALSLPKVAPVLPAILLRRRPDILQAEEGVVAADRRLDSARAAFMPDLKLSASGGLVGSTLLPNPITLFSLGGSLLAPLFEGGRLRAQARVETSRRDQAAFAYRRAVLGALRDVEDALARVRESAMQQRVLEQQRQAQRTALDLATQRYRAGYSPYLEQLDAQRSLLSVELALVQIREDRLNASVALIQALGGGWRREDVLEGRAVQLGASPSGAADVAEGSAPSKPPAPDD